MFIVINKETAVNTNLNLKKIVSNSMAEFNLGYDVWMPDMN